MSENCQLVVFSNKAYNALIRESFDKDPVETGGILLGHVLDNGVWIVMEVLPPGINSIFQYAYFEYDEAFVNYLAQSVANQYNKPLDLLGLWHRHPGSMDVFSSTDDGTNATFARQNPAGVISGLVNIDPNFRLTMYHMDRPTGRLMGRPNYDVVEVEVGDDIIPEEYFELRYFNGEESRLHPTVRSKGQERQVNRNLHENPQETVTSNPTGQTNDVDPQGLDIQGYYDRQFSNNDNHQNVTPQQVNDFFSFWRVLERNWKKILYGLIAIIAIVCTVNSCDNLFGWISDKTHKEEVQKETKPQLSVESITLTLGKEGKRISVNNADAKDVEWESNNHKVATVNKHGMVLPVKVGEATISAYIDKKPIGECKVFVIADVESHEDSTKTQEEQSKYLNTKGFQEVVEEPSFELIETSGNIQVGRSFQMNITKIGNPVLTYESSNDSIASVNKKGVVTGKSVGQATITVCQNGKKPSVYTLNVK